MAQAKESSLGIKNKDEGHLEQIVNGTKQASKYENERRWIVVLTVLFVINFTVHSILAYITVFFIRPSLRTLDTNEILDESDKAHVTQEMSWKMTDSSPVSMLDDVDFCVYFGLITWLTVIFSGIGLEMFFILVYLTDGWTSVIETQWKLAQFLFSILALVTMGLASTRNSASLLTLVFGLWKFGFPETVATMHSALYDVSLDKSTRIFQALDSGGLIIHHSAASLIICMLVTGAIDIDRFIVDPILILCMQHWFSLMQDKCKTQYTIIVLTLEIWFQWDVFSNFEHYVTTHWTIAVASSVMVLAHWVWIVRGALSLPFSRSLSKPTESVQAKCLVSVDSCLTNLTDPLIDSWSTDNDEIPFDKVA